MRFADFPAAALAKDLPDGRHELWSGAGDVQQVLIRGPAEPLTPVAVLVPLDEHILIRLEAVRRLWHRLTGRADTTPVLPITTQQRRRLILMLRAIDGWREHATYRELAAVLLDRNARHQSRHDWLTSPVRAQIIRIVQDAMRRVEGGYRDLLLGH